MQRKPFKIAIIVEDLIVAGVAICSVDLAHALAKIGYDVTLIVLRKPDYDVSWQEGLCVLFFNTPITLRNLTEVLQGFDAIILSNGVALPFGVEAARHTARPLIVEWLQGEVRAHQCPAVDFTIAASEVIFKSMQASEHDVFIPYGVDLSRFRPRQRQRPERVRLIQIAREWKTMDPDLAVLGPELVSQGLPVEADIVGKSGPSSEHVRFHGVQRDVTPILGEADVLLHMARMEPFGMPAIEAMASGAIPIVSNVGGLPWSVLDGVTGFVADFGDGRAVRRIVTELVEGIREGHPRFRRLRENGLDRAQKEFNILENARRVGQYLESKAAQLPRKHRSDAYPFSFVGPVLYYVLQRADQYLCAMADVIHAPDLTEALSHWKEFRGALGHEWKEVSADTWKILDAVYANIARDVSEASVRKGAVCYFWLSFLALVTKRYDLLPRFLSTGSARTNTPGEILPGSTLATISFSLAVSLLEILGIEVDSKTLEAKHQIKKSYYTNDFARLAAWNLGEDLLGKVFSAANHPELLSALRPPGGINIR